MKLFSSLASSSKGKLLIVSAGVMMMLIFLQMSWMNIGYLTSGVGWITSVKGCDCKCADAVKQPDKDDNEPSCIDRLASKYNRAEDIFCQVLPEFLPHLKNPCFYDYSHRKKALLRCLPYFYIIGIDKSGSTDLHGRMALHPLITGNRGSLDKETQFWSWTRYGIFNKRKGDKKLTLEDYLDMFRETAALITRTNLTSFITGDATPMDLWDFRAWRMIPQNEGREEPVILTPHFIKYLYKKPPKFFIQFREPIERLYSDYIFLKYGKDPQTFHKHVLIAIDMMNNCLGNYSRRICYFSDDMYDKLPARVHLGCYSVFLKEWFQVFPRSAFHITRTDEYQNDMEGTLKSVFKFLELPPLPALKMKEILKETRRHVTAKKKGVVLPETQDALRKFYDQCNRETAILLQDDAYLWLEYYT